MKRMALIFLSACSANLSAPDLAEIQCTRSSDCPPKWVCQTTLARCVAVAAINTTPPKLALAVAASPQLIELTFDEAVAARGAVVASNYTTTPAIGIDSALLDADQQTVVLSVHGQQGGQAYTVAVQNVADLAGNLIGSDNQASFTGVAAAPNPSAPEAIAPEAGARFFSATTVSVSWTGRDGARSYLVEVANASDFANAVSYPVVADGPDDPPPTSLTVDTPTAATYFWRVSSDISLGASGGSFFEVLGNTSYVYCPASTSACDDTGHAGNLSNPFQTINRALADAKEHGIGEVRVADRGGGVAYPELVILPGGSDLRGGYGPDFSDASQASGTFVTHIASGGTYTLYADGITTTTVVDSFHFDGGSANVVHTLQVANCTGALTFSNDTISGGVAVTESVAAQVTAETALESGPNFIKDILTAGDGALSSTALSVVSSSVSVSQSTLRGGASTNTSYGLFAADSSGGASVILTDNDIASPAIGNAVSTGVTVSNGAHSRITSNKIRGGSTGLDVNAATTVIANNDICAGVIGVVIEKAWLVNNTICTGDPGRGITPAPYYAVQDLAVGSIVANNILFSRASSGVCYRASNTGVTFENNLLFDCATFVDAAKGDGALTTIGDANTASEFGSPASITSGNVTDAGAETYFSDFSFVGGNLQLEASTPDPIRLGGLDASGASLGSVTDDFNHKTRTCPTPGSNCYSLGAYEED